MGKEEVLEMSHFGYVHVFLQILGLIMELMVNTLQRTTSKCGVNTLTVITRSMMFTQVTFLRLFLHLLLKKTLHLIYSSPWLHCYFSSCFSLQDLFFTLFIHLFILN